MNRKIKTILILLSIFILVFKAEIALSQCTIGATPVNFGNYDVFSNTPLDTTGIISVGCSANVGKADITLGPSSHSGTFNPRQMKQLGGNDLLSYNIYTNVSRTTIFGNGAAGTALIELKRPSGKPQPWTQNVTIYGRIPPGEDVAAGSYSDILTVTVVW